MKPSRCQCACVGETTYSSFAGTLTVRLEPFERSIRWTRSIVGRLRLGRLPSTTSCPAPVFAAADSNPRKNLCGVDWRSERPLSSSGGAGSRFGRRSEVVG